MRKENFGKSKKSVTKSDDLRQQISQDGIIMGNGEMSTVSDGTFKSMDNDAFDKYEEALISDHNNKVEEKSEEWKKHIEEIYKRSSEIMGQFDKVDIRPGKDYILVKPFENNPFTRMKRLENGFIIPEFDPHYKSSDTGDFEEMQRYSIFAIVMETSPQCSMVRKGDIIMYNKNEGVPIPFYDQGLEVVYHGHVKCIVGNKDDLDERWKKLEAD